MNNSWYINLLTNNLQIHTMKEAIIGIDLGNDKIRVSLLTNGPNEIFKFDNQIGYINGKRKTGDEAEIIVCLIFNYLNWKLTNIDERKSKLSC